MSVCVSVCKVLCVRVFTLSVWNVFVAVSSSVVLTINRRRRRRRRRVCTTKNVDENPCLQVGPRRERHPIGHERTHSGIATQPIYLSRDLLPVNRSLLPSIRPCDLSIGIPNDQARSRASIHAWQRRYVDACAHPILYHVSPSIRGRASRCLCI